MLEVKGGFEDGGVVCPHVRVAVPRRAVAACQRSEQYSNIIFNVLQSMSNRNTKHWPRAMPCCQNLTMLSRGTSNQKIDVSLI